MLMDACSGAYGACHHYCDKAPLYDYLQLADAGSSPGGLAVEGRVRKWGETCHYVLFDAVNMSCLMLPYEATISKCTATLSVQGRTWCM